MPKTETVGNGNLLYAHLLTIHCIQGHTISRIWEEVERILDDLDPQWRERIFCAITDGAKNVTGAARRIGLGRRCLQHSLQLFLLYFCVCLPDVSTTISACLSRKTQSTVAVL